MKEELRSYINSNLILVSESDILEMNNMMPRLKRMKQANFGSAFECASISSNDLNSFINTNVETYSNFQQTLFKMIDDRNLIDADVYNKVHLDRRLFSKIRNEYDYHPSKDTVILLALSLELDEKEMESLLDSASYSLPKNNHFDLIIRFCFIHHIYKISDVNELLNEYNCRLFNY